jgi:hypothetical protein
MTPALIAAAMWLMVSLAFILNSVQAPRWLIRIPLGILAAEFVFTIVATYSAECEGGPCTGTEGFAGASYVAIVYVLPAVAVASTIYAIAYGLRHHRRAQS